MILHAPFMGAGLYFEEDDNKEQVKYQAADHELLASAIATKIAHEVDPENQVGCMLAAGTNYACSCKPEDVWAAKKADRKRRKNHLIGTKKLSQATVKSYKTKKTFRRNTDSRVLLNVFFGLPLSRFVV